MLIGSGGGAWKALQLLVNPKALILDCHGLAICGGAQSLHFAWRDIVDISLVAQDPLDAPMMESRPIPTCQLTDEAAARARVPKGQLKLGLAWGMEGTELVALLNQAKEKWGAMSSPR